VTTGGGSVVVVVGATVVGAAVVVGGRVVGATVVGATVVATVVGATVVVVVVLLEVLVVGSVLAGAVDDGSVLAGTVVATLLDGVVDEATDDDDELLPITISPSSSSLAHQISPAINRNSKATPTMITAARGPGSSYQRLVGGTGGGTTGPPPVAVGGITGTSPVIGPVGGSEGPAGIT
jgi:hypothetical protein